MPAGLNVTFTVLKSPNFLLILTSRLAARGCVLRTFSTNWSQLTTSDVIFARMSFELVACFVTARTLLALPLLLVAFFALATVTSLPLRWSPERTQKIEALAVSFFERLHQKHAGAQRLGYRRLRLQRSIASRIRSIGS